LTVTSVDGVAIDTVAEIQTKTDGSYRNSNDIFLLVARGDGGWESTGWYIMSNNSTNISLLLWKIIFDGMHN
jgi:hypothetical protein